MPARTEKGRGWFAMPLAFARDPKLLAVPPATRYLFLELVALSLETPPYGRVSAVQLSSCGHGMRNLRARCGELMGVSLLSYDQEEDSYWVQDGAKWLEQRPQGDTNPTPTPKVSPGQRAKGTEKAPRGAARGAAREELQTNTQTEEERTPSGSVRSSSAQAAPRGTGGATQPAQDQESAGVDGAGTMSRDEAIAFARSEVAKGRAKNPAATGIDTKFSKYDPDRPIIPITSAFGMNGDSE